MGVQSPNPMGEKEKRKTRKILLLARSVCLQTCLVDMESLVSYVSLSHHQTAFTQDLVCSPGLAQK